MKKKFLLLLIFVALCILHSKAQPIIQFEQDSLNFDTVEQNQVVKVDYKFKNIGTDTLIIRRIRTDGDGFYTDCNDPMVLPGKSGSISVMFYSGGKVGIEHNYFAVYSNAKNRTKFLVLQGYVKKPKAPVIPPPTLKDK